MNAPATVADLRDLLDRRRANSEQMMAMSIESLRQVHRLRETEIEMAILAVEAFDLIDVGSLAEDDELVLKLGGLRDMLVSRATA